MITTKQMSGKEQEASNSGGCLPCRIVGGGGCLGASLYLAHHGSKNASRAGKTVSLLFAAGEFQLIVKN